MNEQVNAGAMYLLEEIHKVLERASQAINRPHYDDVKASPHRVLAQRVERQTFIAAFRQHVLRSALSCSALPSFESNLDGNEERV